MECLFSLTKLEAQKQKMSTSAADIQLAEMIGKYKDE